MTKTAEECARQAWEMDIINKGGRPEWIPTLGVDPKIAEVCEERDRLFNEHRIAMRLLKENTELLNAATDRQIAAVEAMRDKCELIARERSQNINEVIFSRRREAALIADAIAALKEGNA